jgi:hypothetical protein
MFRLAIALFLTTAAVVPSAHAVTFAGSDFAHNNFRTGSDATVEYSTSATNKSALTLPGTEIYISPRDSYDFIPAAGYNPVVDWIKENIGESTDKALLKNNEIEEWAMSMLDTKSFQKHQAPKPNESLPGQILRIKDSKDILDASNEVVACHALDEDYHLCHKVNGELSITNVTVEPNGKPSNLFVACHYGEDLWCHVLNAGDTIFSSGHAHVDVMTAKMLREIKN